MIVHRASSPYASDQEADESDFKDAMTFSPISSRNTNRDSSLIL